jgi:hypothetical protein
MSLSNNITVFGFGSLSSQSLVIANFLKGQTLRRHSSDRLLLVPVQ